MCAMMLYSDDARFERLREMAAASIGTNYMKTGWTVGSDAAEASTTDTTIIATAHSAQVGDEIIMTSGDEDGEAREVTAVTANSITLEAALSGTPSATETFNIVRPGRQSENGGKILIIKSSLNQDVYLSIDGSTDHLYVEAGDDLVIDFKGSNVHLPRGDDGAGEEGFIFVKHAGTAPSTGKLIIQIIT